MIVVSAATGQFGRLVIDRLLDRVPVAEVAVAVRDTAKARGLAARGVQVRRGDYNHLDSLRRAFDGVDRLLFISAPTWDSSERMRQHHNVIVAARAAGVGHLIYTSALGADLTDQGGLADHYATERALIDSGTPYTMLRHPIYSEFFIHSGLQQSIDDGELASSTGGRGMNTATRADLAEAAAAILTSPDRPATGYNLTGRIWTYPQLAQTLSDIAGRTITYRELETDAGIMTMLGPAIRSGAFERHTNDLEQILGHPATSLKAAVSAALQSPAAQAVAARRPAPVEA